MENKSTGITFTSLLLLAFIVLKLCNVITWSWGWVLSPLWIPIAIAIVVVAFYAWNLYKKSKIAKQKLYERRMGLSAWQKRLDEMRISQSDKK